ncbi:MAG: 5-(carboxyamino)imidazole ribonucleotide synthase [Rikenellaceae bacterium]
MAKRIGIIGGGQLGLMIAEAARELGVETVALDPAEDAPAFAVTSGKIVAEYTDVEALTQLCEGCDVVTYEFENIPAEVLIPLAEKYNIKQGYMPLLDSQDRLREKNNAQKCGLQTPVYECVDGEESLMEAIEKVGMPAVLKTRTLGYDGHGQAVIRCEADIEKAKLLTTVPCILEGFVDFDFEVSTIVVRSKAEAVVFPIGRNIHRDGILDLCVVPAEISEALREKIETQSIRFMEMCGYEGILTIEYFVKGEEVIFNEMAPRPHNSGHHTIEGVTTSQFMALCRYLLDMPLGDAKLVAPSVMLKNILGEDLEEAKRIAAEGHEGVYVHIYGKRVSKPKRKMGHITYVGLTLAEYDAEWRGRFVQ